MRNPSSSSLRKKLNEAVTKSPSFKLEDQLSDFLLSLIEEFEPKTLVLAGSLARGEWVKGSSDIDIILVTEQIKDHPPTDRFRLSSINGVNVNLSIYTKEEIIEGMKSLSFFILDAIKDGVPLLGGESFAEFESVFREMEEEMKLEKVGKLWTFQTQP